MSRIQIYDTTLRDGTQGENVSFSVDDKLVIARKLDELGIDYIEGGWPGSNPRDKEFFKRATELDLKHSSIAAFGSTRYPHNKVEVDPNVKALLEAKTPVVTIFGKSWDLHTEQALKITEKQNLAMISETVHYIKDQGREVIYDAEHFFDGWNASPEFTLKCLKAAADGAMKGVLDFTAQPLVSSDFNHQPASSTVDSLETAVLEGKLARVVSWYDNEWGFSNRMIDTAGVMAGLI